MQRFNTYQTAPVPSGGSDWQAEINGGGQTEARSVGCLLYTSWRTVTTSFC